MRISVCGGEAFDSTANLEELLESAANSLGGMFKLGVKESEWVREFFETLILKGTLVKL